MTIKDLENVIANDTSVSLAMDGINKYPCFFDTFKDLKDQLKEDGWNREIKELRSFSSILIILKDDK